MRRPPSRCERVRVQDMNDAKIIDEIEEVMQTYGGMYDNTTVLNVIIEILKREERI